MTQSATRETEHEISVAAPAETLYRYIANVENWPQLFPPTVYVAALERHGTDERIQIWATANGEAKTWTSRRTLDPVRRRVGFRQEVSQPPVGAMGGTWIIDPDGPGASLVRLRHDYRAASDNPADLDWIDQAVDRNSRSELAALKASAELAQEAAPLMLSFEDTVQLRGRAADAFDFVNEAGKWAQRLPHVARVDFREDPPGLQRLAMDTRTKDGAVHTTESVRVAFPPEKIVYKQTSPPPLLKLHTGQWTFCNNVGGATATSAHTVVLNAAAIEAVLGGGATVDDARAFIRDALGGNSRATLEAARQYAEAR
jgi:aromatase